MCVFPLVGQVGCKLAAAAAAASSHREEAVPLRSTHLPPGLASPVPIWSCLLLTPTPRAAEEHQRNVTKQEGQPISLDLPPLVPSPLLSTGSSADTSGAIACQTPDLCGGAGGMACCRQAAFLVLILALFSVPAQSRILGKRTGYGGSIGSLRLRSLAELVPEQPLVLDYHGGKVLGAGGGINAYILWYGHFPRPERAIISGFFRSIQQSGVRSPSVKSWWKLAGGYKDTAGTAVPASVKLAGHSTDAGSLGKNLKDADMEQVLERALNSSKLPVDDRGIYFLLTAADVLVESFCRNSCGTHSVLPGRHQLPYAWIGNAGTQCPGMCAWPFAPLSFLGAPATAPATSPNGDVGIDGMVINIAAMLAGASTNPYGDAFYQGDALAPLEAATACTGNYGSNSYPGYPGDLLTVKSSGSNFNVYGYKRWKYLLPSLWDPTTLACAVSS